MQEITVVILSSNEDQRTMLGVQVDGTAVARVVGSFSDYPVGSKDQTLKRIQELGPAVILIDIPEQHAAPAVHCVDLLHTNMPEAAVFVIGDLNRPQQI